MMGPDELDSYIRDQFIFQPPRPIDAWAGDLTATNLGSKCIQFAHIHDDPADRVSGSEDCLYLNVYAPVDQTSSSVRNGTLLPVIIYIHSGAFQFGQGSQRPHFLMDMDVVFVSFNYRLGPLGNNADFICTPLKQRSF